MVDPDTGEPVVLSVTRLHEEKPGDHPRREQRNTVNISAHKILPELKSYT
jgi:hypothetical protein